MERVTEASVRRQRVIQTTLLFIILATLPCYCVGFVLLGVAPSRGVRTATPIATRTNEAGDQPTPTLFKSITPFPTLIENTLSPLLPTPTQLRFNFTLTWTPIVPTKTPVVQPTWTPIVIVPPTATNIIVPTSTPVTPTATKAPPSATSVPPTATTVPPSATSIPPTATNVPPSATTV